MMRISLLPTILSLALLCTSCEGVDIYKIAPEPNNPWSQKQDPDTENPDEPDPKPDEPVVNVTCIEVDPMQKIYLEDSSFESFVEVIPYAKGETATFQFVLRCQSVIENLSIDAQALSNGSASIVSSLKAFERYTIAGLHLEPKSNVAHFPASDKYPDCLDESETTNVEANTNLPIWVNYYIPKTVEAGIYSGNIVLRGSVGGKQIEITKSVSLEVKNVTLPEQTLYVSNWANFDQLLLMNNWQKVEPFSNLYYDLVNIIVEQMSAHGNNVFFLESLCMFIDCFETSGNWTFSFTKFDKMVEIFLEKGKAKYIEGGHIAKRIGDWDSEFGVRMPTGTTLSLNDESAQRFLEQFIAALSQHLKVKGWWDKYIQHIGDEPVDSNTKSYLKIAKFIKNIAPDIKILDAIQTTSDMDNVIDIWVPLLDFWHKQYSFYNNRRLSGDQSWYYTCLSPKGNYANRLLEQPLIQMRLLHWINYKYTATGYLHWGYNQAWSYATQYIGSEGFCPGGDMYIVYPAYRKVHSSIRFEAMRDGIADYELLNLLDSKNKSAAVEIVNSMVYNFDSYNNSNSALREARKKLLEALEK